VRRRTALVFAGFNRGDQPRLSPVWLDA